MRMTEIENICIYIKNEVERITQFECVYAICDFYVDFTATKGEYIIVARINKDMLNSKGCNMSGVVVGEIKEEFLKTYFYYR